MDQQGFHQDSNNYLLPPGQLPIRQRQDKEDGTEEVHFPLPPGITRSHHAGSSSRSLQPLTHHSFQSSALSDRSFAPEYTVQPHQSHRRTPSNVSNDSFGPATDPRYQHSPSLFPEEDPWSSIHNPDLTHFGFPPVNQSQHNPFPQFPPNGNHEVPLFSVDDLFSSHTPSPFDASHIMQDPSLYGVSQSPYNQPPQPQQFISSQSPFLAARSPSTAFIPFSRAHSSPDRGTHPSNIPPPSFDQDSAKFAPSPGPFAPNQFLSTPSHLMPSTALPILPGPNNCRRGTSIPGHRLSASGNLRQTSNLLSPHTAHSRHSSAGSVQKPRHQGRSSHSRVSSRNSADFFDQLHAPSTPFDPHHSIRLETPAVVPHQGSESTPSHSTVQREPPKARSLEDLVEQLEQEAEKNKQERLGMTRETQEISDRINSLAGRRDRLIGTGRSGQREINDQLHELRANRTRMYEELREFDKRTSAASAQLVELREIRSRYAA